MQVYSWYCILQGFIFQWAKYFFSLYQIILCHTLKLLITQDLPGCFLGGGWVIMFVSLRFKLHFCEGLPHYLPTAAWGSVSEAHVFF